MQHKPQKKFGQNFLIQPAIAGKIVQALNIAASDHIIEIGPGKGILSQLIAEAKTAAFSVVEIDSILAAQLAGKYSGQINVIEGDFLKIDLSRFLSPATILKVIGNIPYNITSPILFKLADFYKEIDCAVLMMQKEVAQRVAAGPGSKVYGILSVLMQTIAEVDYLFVVGRKNFYPVPKVDSAVIRINFRQNIEGLADPGLFRKIVRTAFNYRRKMLKNSLTRIFDQSIVTSLSDFDLTKRPEQLSIDDFKRLTNTITQNI